ncbi:uncharacterized protein CTRU02_202248 [Colletotrichum truncatum]|uniref:Uncharacterized protein n=1 Tax=Colletotrichum truncatum TaxID=5467 RepID=A0ACC3ZJR2_COLTU
MADSQGNTPSATNAGEGPSSLRAGAWTDTERNHLMMRILASLLPDGKGVEWKNINMPGRTVKAMQNQWTTILAQMRELNMGGDESSPSKPRACESILSSSQKKNMPKKAVAAAESKNADDISDDTPKKPNTPKKRGASTIAEGSVKKRRTPAKKTPVKVEADKTDDEVKPKEKTDEQDN